MKLVLTSAVDTPLSFTDDCTCRNCITHTTESLKVKVEWRLLKWLGWLRQSQSMGEVPGLRTYRFVNGNGRSCTMTCYSNSCSETDPTFFFPYLHSQCLNCETVVAHCRAMPRLLPPHPLVQGGQRWCYATGLQDRLTEAEEVQWMGQQTRVGFVSR